MRSSDGRRDQHLRRVRALHALTAREATVLQYMREGLNTRGIAERLGISERTVYEYRTVIYQKLGTKDVDSLP